MRTWRNGDMVFGTLANGREVIAGFYCNGNATSAAWEAGVKDSKTGVSLARFEGNHGGQKAARVALTECLNRAEWFAVPK